MGATSRFMKKNEAKPRISRPLVGPPKGRLLGRHGKGFWLLTDHAKKEEKPALRDSVASYTRASARDFVAIKHSSTGPKAKEADSIASERRGATNAVVWIEIN
ncbi:hypothetical protein EVAR_18115_1 [Eumeta japonica]|uniref:Uncharacterized protein n=1 Tax=Eumeta variegata TaxID=151549 RepID=A0A4C1VKI3_EUMVA|nr:hypothetical protein EVAR_18115_1 [Eumeta japonica]